MSWRDVTKWLIILVPVLIAFYDIVAYRRGGNEATISKVCLDVSLQYRLFALVFVFALGLLCGHLFAPQQVSK